MRAKALMVQGTSSHVGKSVIAAALCRCLSRRGLRVAPFKAQNMSLNSAVTADGGEIGRSQAFQAAACGIEPEVSMNPILLKPMAGGRCQVIVRGRPYRTLQGYADHGQVDLARRIAAECIDELADRFDVLVLEGMGSPAEINLRERDVANMHAAALADAAVLLVGDIERGGVFAAMVGTIELLSPDERKRIRGFLINKFHGNPQLLTPGLLELEQRYGIPTLGVLPYQREIQQSMEAAEEDAVALEGSRSREAAAIDVVVPRLPHISNFTDLAPLASEEGVSVRYISHPDEWGIPALAVLPGTRSTASDLAWLRETGLSHCLLRHAEHGGQIIGLCGGYQMLGHTIDDPDNVEEDTQCSTSQPGLGLLNVSTHFQREKSLSRVRGVSLIRGMENLPVEGYEIHHGVTTNRDESPALRLLERGGAGVDELDGAVDSSGAIMGVYLHGLFDQSQFRRALLSKLGGESTRFDRAPSAFDLLADWLETHSDLPSVLAAAGISIA